MGTSSEAATNGPTALVSGLVSVLVPAYNHERFVVSCLDSVKRSGFERVELLVLDDGSSDSTASVAQRWITEHGHCFERAEISSRPNAGICATLNELVRWSSGDYVCVLASDDELIPGGISARVDYLGRHPELQAVICDIEFMDDNGVTIAPSALDAFGYRRSALRPDRMLNAFLCSWTQPFTFQFFRGEWSRSNPYPADLGFEDYWSALVLSRDGLVGVLTHPCLRYRVPVDRSNGRLSETVLTETHRETLERVLEARRSAPLVALTMLRARRNALRPGHGDPIARLVRLVTMPWQLRYRRIGSLLASSQAVFRRRSA